MYVENRIDLFLVVATVFATVIHLSNVMRSRVSNVMSATCQFLGAEGLTVTSDPGVCHCHPVVVNRQGDSCRLRRDKMRDT